ncbi:MAG: amino acid permease, partial [Armatimonadota bacterium]
TRLIPLYAVGVFISFTLSQFGMAVRQRRLKEKNWQIANAISIFGGCVTLIVAAVVAVSKFMIGAWIAVVLIAVLVLTFRKINQHYRELGEQLRITEPRPARPIRSTSIVLAAGIHKGILQALEYAASLSHDCRALYIEIDPSETALIRDRWEKYGMGIPLVILESPYRTVIGPTVKYLEEVKKERPDHIVTVVLPEFVPAKWWHKLLHNQSGLMLKLALLLRRDIVVTNVRYYLEK